MKTPALGYVLLGVGVFVLLFAKKGASIVERSIGLMMYKKDIDEAMQEAGLDYELRPLVYAMVEQESDFNTRAYRWEERLGTASYGLMQILETTARGLGFKGNPEDLYDPFTGVYWGCRFLRTQLARYDNNLEAAVEAYNRGRELVGGTTAYAASVFAKANRYTDVG